MNLKTKLVLILLPLVIAPLLILGKISHDQLVSKARDDLLLSMDTTLTQLVDMTEYNVNMASSNMTLFAQDFTLNAYIKTPDSKKRQEVLTDPILRLFSSYSYAFPDYYEYRLASELGDVEVQYSIFDDAGSEKISDQHFSSIIDAPTDIYVQFTLEPRDENPMLLMSKRLRPQFALFSEPYVSDYLHSYLIVSVTPSFLKTFIDTHTPGEEGAILIGNSSGEIYYGEFSLISELEFLPNGFAGYSSPRRIEVEGKAFYVQSRELYSGLYAYAVLPENEVAAAGDQLGAIIVLITLASIVASFLLLFIAISFLIIRPIGDLARLTRRFGGGDWSVRVDAQSNDEVGDLYRQVDAMMVNIRAAYRSIAEVNDELETKVTERTLGLKDANEKLRSAMDQAHQSSRAKTEFLANMSHEIRTPMNGMLGMAELLTETSLDDKQHNYVSQIRQSGENLLDLLNDILDMSRVEAGKLQLDPVRCNLRELSEQVQNLLSRAASEKKLDFNIVMSKSVPKYVLVDDLRLRQILINLVGNAIKFTRHGFVEIHIEAEGTTKQTSQKQAIWDYVFTIKDSGIGIAEEALHKVFDDFTQEDASTTRQYGGSGLGLSITRKLTQLMGGTVSLSSELGMGSEFSISLSLPVLPEPTEEELQAIESTHLKSLNGLKVLLAEDNLVNQRVAVAMLKSMSCDVDVANDGGEAWQAYQRSSYDVILMDVQMPIMNGIEVTKKIRAHEAGSSNSALIIAMTANALEGDKEACITAGMNDYISKPVRRGVLNSCLQQALKP